MVKTFENLTEEDMCDLMCGKPEEDDFNLTDNEKEFLSILFNLSKRYLLSAKDDAQFSVDELHCLAEKLGVWIYV